MLWGVVDVLWGDYFKNFDKWWLIKTPVSDGADEAVTWPQVKVTGYLITLNNVFLTAGRTGVIKF